MIKYPELVQTLVRSSNPAAIFDEAKPGSVAVNTWLFIDGEFAVITDLLSGSDGQSIREVRVATEDGYSTYPISEIRQRIEELSHTAQFRK